jgi:hypothetical protein
MSTGNASGEPRTDSGVNYYMVVCLAALVVVLIILAQRGFGYWSLFPLLVGAVGVATRWGSAPTMLLLTVAVCLNTPSSTLPLSGRRMPLRVSDLLLCGAVLAYVAAHYRYQCLAVNVFPPDPRRRESPQHRKTTFLGLRRPPEVVQQRRSPGLVSQWEVGLLVLSLPVWSGLAQVWWNWLPGQWGNPALPAPLWRAMLLVWVLGVGVLAAAAILDYWGRRRLTAEEATLFLQDVLWHETRREQRRLNRWLAWARIRHLRGKPSRKPGEGPTAVPPVTPRKG